MVKKVEEAKSTGEEEEEGITSEEESNLPEDDYSKGVVFYMKPENGRIVGVLTWNLFGKMDLAREVRMVVVSYVHGLLRPWSPTVYTCITLVWGLLISTRVKKVFM